MSRFISGLLFLAAACAPPVTAWGVRNGMLRPTTDEGHTGVLLEPIGGDRHGSNVAMALLPEITFEQGSIDVDLKGQGQKQRSFVGVTFAVTGANEFEAVYFRPFNFIPEDPAHRTHAVQYVAWPEHTWEALREQTPGGYEAAVDPVPDPAGWFHAHVEVTPDAVRVFVNGASAPCLVVKRLRPAQPGRVGLWVDSHGGTFANLVVKSGAETH